MTASWYNGALADIHDSDYGFLARAAAATAMAKLPAPEESGIIVDLGCGSGITAEILDNAGYSVMGVDASPDMISIARQRVPSGDFVTSSIYDINIPDCQAVLAIGEVFNYESEDRTREGLARLLRQVSNSVRLDGFLLCDIAGPGRVNKSNAHQTRTGDGWTMRVEATENSANRELTRDIVIDVAEGWKGRVPSHLPLPRSVQLHETHRLELIEPAEFESILEVSGLRRQQLTCYFDFDFPPGWSGWFAQPVR